LVGEDADILSDTLPVGICTGHERRKAFLVRPVIETVVIFLDVARDVEEARYVGAKC
jgi:hypothetical protein